VPGLSSHEICPHKLSKESLVYWFNLLYWIVIEIYKSLSQSTLPLGPGQNQDHKSSSSSVSLSVSSCDKVAGFQRAIQLYSILIRLNLNLNLKRISTIHVLKVSNKISNFVKSIIPKLSFLHGLNAHLKIQNIKNPIWSQVHGVVASDVQWFI